MICRLETLTPLVVGNHQTSGAGRLQPTKVEQFVLDGEPAIPASSLRGLVASTAEAASNSALRVLATEWDRWEDGYGKRGAHSASSSAREIAKVDPDLVQLGKCADRKALTPAELLFGFVEHRDPSLRDAGKAALALASRVRFSHALPAAAVTLLAPVVLRELASPKPPRASLYFRPDSRSKIPATDARPKGRKFYLPAPSTGAVGWRTTRHPVSFKEKKESERQLEVQPIPEHTAFWFHVDFSSLSAAELDLLCYALAPNATYLHRLGLGKPLGLGLVRIEPAALLLVDRARRYRGCEGNGGDWWTETRHHETWLATDQRLAPEAWPPRFDRDRSTAHSGISKADSPADRAARFRSLAVARGHGSIIESLELLGDRSRVRHPVHYPAIGGRNLEDRLFEWFMRSSQYLPELPNGGVIPALDR